MLYYQDFKSVKNQLKQYIIQIGDKAGKPSLYGDIKTACEKRRAFVFVGNQCFTVLKPIVRGDENGVLVWVAYAKHPQAIARHQYDVEQLSKQINATFLEFWTKRQGFERVAPRYGYVTDRVEDGYTVWRKGL